MECIYTTVTLFPLSVRFCLFKAEAKSKGQVVTSLIGTDLGASNHLMWGR